jgi:hypothetical protein
VLIYRERQERESPARLLRVARERLAGLAPGHAGIHDRVVALLIDLGVLESAVADAVHPHADAPHPVTGALRAASVAAGHLLWHSWRGQVAEMPAWAARAAIALGAAERGGLPAEIAPSVPEGYAYYGLYPETYLVAVDRLARACRPSRVVCIGLRSIGTSLSAVAAAAFEELGGEVLTLTLRPHGHPFDRHPRLSPALATALRAQATDLFVLVDEGPGLSGSSLAGTARTLEELGVLADRIVLMPSWRTDGRALRSAEARARWQRHPQFTASFEETWVDTGRLGSALQGRVLENLSAGAWRPLVFGQASDYPPVQPQHERRKYLARTPSGTAGDTPDLLLRFAGLGTYGERRLARAQSLAALGLGAAPVGLTHGFLAQPFSEGTPASEDAAEELVPVMADYLACVRRHCAASGAIVDLGPMVETNVREAIDAGAGDRARERLAELANDVAPTALDARMFPHEWLRTPAGWVKVDAVDHHDDHFYPGPQDIAWDVAGTCLEFRLAGGTRRAFIERYRAASGDGNIHQRLPAYALAYAAYRVGYATLAAEQLRGSADGARFEARAQAYRRMLVAELAPGAAVAWRR